MAENAKEVKENKPATKYTKTRLMTSESYKAHRDLLSVILSDDMEYTKAEVDKAIDDYMKGKVM